MTTVKDIPISAAARIGLYGYDQVVIIARRVDRPDEPGREHVTTWGKTPENCNVAARVGDFLKHKVMGWQVSSSRDDELIAMRRALVKLTFMGRTAAGTAGRDEALCRALDEAERVLGQKVPVCARRKPDTDPPEPPEYSAAP